jgi:phosphohistidine phosphatase
MGELITEFGMTPDLVITSSAVRATTTAKLAAESGGWECPIRETDDFYEASVGVVLNELRHLPDSVEKCLIIGHDTTCTRTVQVLTGANTAMRTATVAAIDIGAPWGKIGNRSGQLIALLQPRHFL